MTPTELTPAARLVLELIDSNPGISLSGPNLAMANKMRKRGLVEAFTRPVDKDHADEVLGYRTTMEGRRVLGRGLTDDLKAKVEQEIVAVLHAHRDCLRNRGQDTSKVTFDCNDGYYGEAVGIMRALRLLGFGDFGAVNTPQKHTNLSWWLGEIERQVLAEENYGGSNQCDYCLERWGKDGAGRKRS